MPKGRKAGKANKRLGRVSNKIRDARRADIEGMKKARMNDTTFETAEPPHASVMKAKAGKRKNSVRISD